MRYFLICFLLIPFFTFSQADKTKWLQKKFKSADTILLISHDKFIQGSTIDVVDSNGSRVNLPKLIIDDKLNRAVVKQEKIINGKSVDSLVNILMQQTKDSVIWQGGCFVPRQSIIIIKGSQTSFIDLCFHCRSYETSKDLENVLSIDQYKWDALENYFRNQGLTYQLDDPE